MERWGGGGWGGVAVVGPTAAAAIGDGGGEAALRQLVRGGTSVVNFARSGVGGGSLQRRLAHLLQLREAVDGGSENVSGHLSVCVVRGFDVCLFIELQKERGEGNP